MSAPGPAGSATAMHRTLVLDIVGLSPRHLGAHTPNLTRLAERGAMRPLTPTWPAVTTSVQSSFVTGAAPSEHGIVANGWYFRDLSEIWFWRQSNRLVQGEVGSGKTLVALRAMLAVADSGGQSAFLAPTEVLAGQHLRSIVATLTFIATGALTVLAVRQLFGGIV